MLRRLLLGLLACACVLAPWVSAAGAGTFVSATIVAPSTTPANLPLVINSPPTVPQWVDMVQEVRRHPLFQGIHLSYGRAPAENVHYTPVGVMEREGQDCVVIVAEGDNPKMRRILKLSDDPQALRALLLTMAAHELGHCFRIRGRHLSAALWERVHASAVGSPERQALEKAISIEEAYADAYAFAFLQDAYPQHYKQVFQAMHSLRYDPYFATAFYQVDPLYQELSTHGVDTSLPLPQRVEALMQRSRF